MPLLVNELPVWDIGFRLAGHEPRKLWFRVPIEVEDCSEGSILTNHLPVFYQLENMKLARFDSKKIIQSLQFDQVSNYTIGLL